MSNDALFFSVSEIQVHVDIKDGTLSHSI